MTEDEEMTTFEEQVLMKFGEALQKFFEEAAEKLTPVIDAVAKAASIIAEAEQETIGAAEEMTNEEAIEELQDQMNGEIAEFGEENIGYTIKAYEMAIEALQERTTAQGVTEAAETHDFHEGELIVYQNGDTFQIGEIKRICDDGAFVWYHEGNTASKTPFENMHKLRNAYCITQTAFALDRPICADDCEHCEFATCPKEE